MCKSKQFYYSLNSVVRGEDLLPAQCLYGSLINKNMYKAVAILKIKMAAKIGKIQLGIHPEKSSFFVQSNYVPNFMLLSKSAQFAQNLSHICPARNDFSYFGKKPPRQQSYEV